MSAIGGSQANISAVRCRSQFIGMSAAEVRRKRVERMRAFTYWRWHLDEAYVKIGGETYYLWRAVDHEGEVVESFATKDRDKAAALKFMKKLMKRHGSAKAVTTDGPRLQKFASVQSQVHNHFNQQRHLISNQQHRQRRTAALTERRSVMA